MTMERDELSAYRKHLLERLQEHPERIRREEPVSLQVFVNDDCVGTLEGGEPQATLAYASHGRPIRTVELRNATGLLVAAIRPDEVGSKCERVQAGQVLINLEVANQETAGTLRVTSRTAGTGRQRIGHLLASVTGNGPDGGRTADRIGGFRPGLAVAAQVVLATAVLFLVADRFSERLTSRTEQAREESVSQRLLAMETVLAKQEQALARLGESQQVSMGTLEAEQQGLKAQAVNLQRLVQEYQQRITDEFDARLRTVQSRGDQTQAQMQQLASMREMLARDLAALKHRQASLDQQAAARREEVQHLMTAKEILNREIAALKKREIEQGLKQQAVVMARILSPQEQDRAEGNTAEITVLPAPASSTAEIREEETRPFTFRVSFQDGTSEENIQRLIRTINGRLGTTNSGWYTVEVPLPKPQTPEGFIESLRREKIVKALSLSNLATTAPAGPVMTGAQK